jgi:DNA-binding CsgD family transcriptional regulator
VRESDVEVPPFDRTSEAVEKAEPDATEHPPYRWFELDPTPVLILAGDATVLHKNPAARKLLQERAAASLMAGRLLFMNEDARRSFAAALTKVATGRAARISVVLRCDDGQWRLLHLARGTDSGSVFVRLGRETAASGDITPLVEAFRLSAAEGKILWHLAQGLPPKWIASRLDISPNTVRAHLRNLYLKTHVHGLCDLIREYTRLTD